METDDNNYFALEVLKKDRIVTRTEKKQPTFPRITGTGENWVNQELWLFAVFFKLCFAA